MLVPRGLLALVTVPAFAWVVHAPSATSVLGVTVLISALTALARAGSIVGIPEALPRAVRSAGLAISYALSVTLFGGSTQWVVNKLIIVTGDRLSPAYYLAATSLVGAAAAFLMPAQRNFTDQDSRILPAREGFVQGYNGQIAVDAAYEIIVAHRLVTNAADAPALVPFVDNVRAHLGRKPREVSGDVGFANEANVRSLAGGGLKSARLHD